MLISALVTLLLLGSGAGLMLDGIGQMHVNIKSEIVDDDSRKAALEIVDRLEGYGVRLCGCR